MRPNLYIFICMKRKSINYISKHIWHVWCLGSSWEISEKFKMTWNDVAAAAISGSVWPCSGYQKTAAGNFLFFSQQVEQAFFCALGLFWGLFVFCRRRALRPESTMPFPWVGVHWVQCTVYTVCTVHWVADLNWIPKYIIAWPWSNIKFCHDFVLQL